MLMCVLPCSLKHHGQQTHTHAHVQQAETRHVLLIHSNERRVVYSEKIVPRDLVGATNAPSHRKLCHRMIESKGNRRTWKVSPKRKRKKEDSKTLFWHLLFAPVVGTALPRGNPVGALTSNRRAKIDDNRTEK
jgi:hypothetical protein